MPDDLELIRKLREENGMLRAANEALARLNEALTRQVLDQSQQLRLVGDRMNVLMIESGRTKCTACGGRLYYSDRVEGSQVCGGCRMMAQKGKADA